MVGLLGEKLTFFNSLGTTKISRNVRLSVYINVVLLITFQNNLNYASTSNIREVIKFYNLGDNTFETDFNCRCIRTIIFVIVMRFDLLLLLGLAS